MHIPPHQIENVIKAYKRLIVRKKNAGREQVCVSPGRRRKVVETITRDISRRIIANRRTRPDPATDPAGQVREGELIYHTHAADGGKVSRKLILDSADFLIEGIERLARDETDLPDKDEGK